MLLLGSPARSAAGVFPADRWVELVPTGALVPPARREMALVYDRARERVIVFGGRSGSTVLDDTWAFDLATGVWREIALLPAARPEARFSAIAGVDEARERMLVTTGQGAGGGFFNDVWSLDLRSDAWSRLAPAGGPPATRYGSAGGIHPGAAASALYLSHGFTSSGRFEDTWQLDLASDTWREVTPAPPRPVRRCLHAAALPLPDALVLFGGCASGAGPCPLADVWRFEGLAWRDQTPPPAAPAPSPRTFPALASLAGGETLLLFGGSDAGDRNDAWFLNARNGAFQASLPAGSAPSPRAGSGLVWVDRSSAAQTGTGCGHALVFGGSLTSDLWALLPAVQPRSPVIRLAKRNLSDVELRWAHDPEHLEYEVWRAAAPRFEPGMSGPDLLPGPVTMGGGEASYLDLAPPPVAFYVARIARCQGL